MDLGIHHDSKICRDMMWWELFQLAVTTHIFAPVTLAPSLVNESLRGEEERPSGIDCVLVLDPLSPSNSLWLNMLNESHTRHRACSKI